MTLSREVAAFLAHVGECLAFELVPNAAYDDYVAKILPRAELLLSFSCGRIVGLLAFYCNDEDSLQAYITMVAIDPNHRRQGLAERLVVAAMDHARAKCFTSLRLTVHPENQPGIALYEKLGFKRREVVGRQIVMEARFDS